MGETMEVREGPPEYGPKEERIPPGYKRTEVGVVPVEWSCDRVAAHAYITTGSKNTQDRDEGGRYPFFVRSQHVERIDTYSFNCEAVLTAGDGVGTGKVFHYVDERFDVHQRVYCISGFSGHLSGKFFFYQFCTRFYERIMSMTAKSSVDSVRMDMISDMQIPLPPLPEQRAIARALSDVDDLISALDKLIEKKRAIKQATMQQLLTGRTRLPGFGGEWELHAFRDLLTIRHGRSQSDVVTAGGRYPVLATSGIIGWTDSYLHKGPSVLIGRKGTIDEPRFMDSPFWTVDTLFYTDVSREVSAKFMYYRFCLVRWASYNEASGVPSLNAHTIESIEAMIPPLPEQRAIATVLSDMDAGIAALERRREKTRMVKQGMMQELLTGRIRLVEVAAG